MKKTIFILIFVFAFGFIFAAQRENKITKEILQEQFSSEISVLAKELNQVKTQTEQQKNQQSANQDIYFETILKEISAAVKRSIQQNNEKMNSSLLKEYPEYAQDIKHYDQFYKSLNSRKITAQITAYSKKIFPDINKMQKIHAACFSDSQLHISFIYEGQKSQIFYQFDSGYISHVIAQKTAR